MSPRVFDMGLYDALRAAGVSEDAARAGAGLVLPSSSRRKMPRVHKNLYAALVSLGVSKPVARAGARHFPVGGWYLHLELYDALREAGVSEDVARAGAQIAFHPRRLQP